MCPCGAEASCCGVNLAYSGFVFFRKLTDSAASPGNLCGQPGKPLRSAGESRLRSTAKQESLNRRSSPADCVSGRRENPGYWQQATADSFAELADCSAKLAQDDGYATALQLAEKVPDAGKKRPSAAKAEFIPQTFTVRPKARPFQRIRVFPQAVKPCPFKAAEFSASPEALPFQSCRVFSQAVKPCPFKAAEFFRKPRSLALSKLPSFFASCEAVPLQSCRVFSQAQKPCPFKAAEFSASCEAVPFQSCRVFRKPRSLALSKLPSFSASCLVVQQLLLRNSYRCATAMQLAEKVS